MNVNLKRCRTIMNVVNLNNYVELNDAELEKVTGGGLKWPRQHPGFWSLVRMLQTYKRTAGGGLVARTVKWGG